MSRLHPFFDGNKRTSFIIAATILRLNGFFLNKSDEDEIFYVLNKISDAEIDCDLHQIEQWLKKKSHKWWKTTQKTIYDYL